MCFAAVCASGAAAVPFDLVPSTGGMLGSVCQEYTGVVVDLAGAASVPRAWAFQLSHRMATRHPPHVNPLTQKKPAMRHSPNHPLAQQLPYILMLILLFLLVVLMLMLVLVAWVVCVVLLVLLL